MSSNLDRVEVFSAIQRRRRYSVDQKLAVLAEAAQPGMSISYVARRHGVRRVAEVLNVSRSQLTERLKRRLKPRTHYRKSEDAELLLPLRRLLRLA